MTGPKSLKLVCPKCKVMRWRIENFSGVKIEDVDESTTCDFCVLDEQHRATEAGCLAREAGHVAWKADLEARFEQLEAGFLAREAGHVAREAVLEARIEQLEAEIRTLRNEVPGLSSRLNVDGFAPVKPSHTEVVEEETTKKKKKRNKKKKKKELPQEAEPQIQEEEEKKKEEKRKKEEKKKNEEKKQK